MSNSIYNRSYATKRLHEGGFPSQRVVTEYNEDDNRRWTILLDREDKRVFITCHRDGNKGWFTITHKNGQRLTVETKSLEVLMSQLTEII